MDAFDDIVNESAVGASVELPSAFNTVWDWFTECHSRDGLPGIVSTMNPILYYASIVVIICTGFCIPVCNAVYHLPIYHAQFILVYAYSLLTNQFVTFGKEAIGDYACSSHPNSISGHVAFYSTVIALFAVMAVPGSANLPYKWQTTRRVLFHAAWVAVFMLPLVGLALLVLAETYLGGYHTPRQMVFGFLFSLCLIASFMGLVVPMLATHRPFSTHLSGVVVVASMTCVGAYLQGGVEVESTVLPMVLAALALALLVVAAAFRSWMSTLKGGATKLLKYLEQFSDGQDPSEGGSDSD
ncbi:hypothetical protein J8273_5033 [Carpediemonas membranifera]|uniref:PAP2 superfamily protein n=1 Tax=Carpediemonas membranifera TaxID=201153 RepID=A0A8J6BXJ2_9EUKA|nr:hypothetical protein J8273_5033 [Carpediemonas membranifera]|eukprot:KAG9393546.1 hypothetical protein J8273_5033 [Carpediemonas membranifera]